MQQEKSHVGQVDSPQASLAGSDLCSLKHLPLLPRCPALAAFIVSRGVTSLDEFGKIPIFASNEARKYSSEFLLSGGNEEGAGRRFSFPTLYGTAFVERKQVIILENCWIGGAYVFTLIPHAKDRMILAHTFAAAGLPAIVVITYQPSPAGRFADARPVLFLPRRRSRIQPDQSIYTVLMSIP